MSVGSKDQIAPTPYSAIVSLNESGGQPELFPLRSAVEFPNTVNGADVWGRVIAEDGRVYIVKGTKAGPLVPACEWVGTLVAEALSLTCARPKVIQLQSGELLFGSPGISGVANQVETTRLLTSISEPPAGIPIPGLRAALSEIYALDMFLNNLDRHDQNFVTARNGATATLYVIDFARCLFWHDSFDGFPAQNQNTVVKGKEFRRRHGFDHDAANRMVDRIVSLTADRIKGILLQMPSEWLPEPRRQAFLQWWDGLGRRRKLEALRKGLEDGSLL